MFSEKEIVEIYLLSLRVGPVLLFAPPFTLMRIPVLVRVATSLLIGSWLSSAQSVSLYVGDFPREISLVLIASSSISELMVGMVITLALQISYASILIVGRSLDIQAGFGLALIADPTLRGQLPLIGTIQAYAFGAFFFAVGGGQELLGLWMSSIQRIPIGSFTGIVDLTAIAEFLSASLSLSIGLVGTVFLTLFLIDLTIAFLSRTLPQMNALLLGFQVKTLALLITLPIAFATSVTVFLRLLRGSFELVGTLI